MTKEARKNMAILLEKCKRARNCNTKDLERLYGEEFLRGTSNVISLEQFRMLPSDLPRARRYRQNTRCMYQATLEVEEKRLSMTDRIIKYFRKYA